MKTHSKPYAIVEKNGRFTRYDGDLCTFSSLKELQDFHKEQTKDIFFLTPFRVIRERGFEAHGDEPILAINISQATPLTREQVENTLSHKQIVFERPIVPTITDEEFIKTVQKIQDDEIAGGNICQMILSQPYSGKIQNFGKEDAEAAFLNCLKQTGQYMTVLMSDGQGNYFVSLTPEQHLQITPSETTMNPIAGTMRKGDSVDLKDRLLAFLRDPKEIKELFQVLDEELKMMEVICDEGGSIEGPFLRQNGAVIHTEYRLIGKRNSALEPIDTLRETLHAPTLVGGPIESATALIKKYEPISRGYYGGEIGMLSGNTLDTAILIRTAYIQSDGTVTIQAGAGITRDSIPINEAQEIRLKTSGMQAALLGKTYTPPDVQDILDDPEILAALKERNRHLSAFHFLLQTNRKAREELIGKTVTIINNKDNFAGTIGRMMARMGMKVKIVDTLDFNPDTDMSDIVVIGPGPGDINDMNDLKMKTLASHTNRLCVDKRNILGVCLGHQSIAREMGFNVERQDISTQGEQREIDFFGTPEKFGFYNSFSPVSETLSDESFAIDENNRIMAMRKGNISGFQFHPESIMSKNGFEILEHELIRILSVK